MPLYVPPAPAQVHFDLLSGTLTTGQTSIQTLGGSVFDPSELTQAYGLTRSIVFASQFFTTAGTAEVTLFDIANNVVIATLTTTSNIADEQESGLITIGTPGPLVIANSKLKYEVRARFSTGIPSVTDRVSVEWAGFIVTYQ